MSVSLSSEQVEQLQKTVAEGRKIDAIKQAREWTGWGLKEAKDFVEGLVAEEPTDGDPRAHRTQAPTKRSGCMTVLALGIVGAVGLVVVFT